MKNKYVEQATAITAVGLFVIFIGIAILFSYHIVYEAGYKKACEDFYQGKLKYDIITNSDGTLCWEKTK